MSVLEAALIGGIVGGLLGGAIAFIRKRRAAKNGQARPGNPES